MNTFEITVQESKYGDDLECHVSLVSNGYEDALYYRKEGSPPEYTYLARVANSVMSRFCALLYPRYEIMISLGKLGSRYSYYGGPDDTELHIRIKGYMDEIEKHRMIEMLNRIVAESQREAYNA